MQVRKDFSDVGRRTAHARSENATSTKPRLWWHEPNATIPEDDESSIGSWRSMQGAMDPGPSGGSIKPAHSSEQLDGVLTSAAPPNSCKSVRGSSHTKTGEVLHRLSLIHI